MLKRPELDEVFIKYAKSKMAETNAVDDSNLVNGESVVSSRMTAENLADFMKKEQKIEMVIEECEKLIEAFEPTQDRSSLSMEGFTHFMMFSEWHDVTDIAHRNLVYQDMTQPLSHYWMASSHNT